MEQWRATKYPGYEVSSLGRVRSVDRIDSVGRHRKGRVLRPCGSGGSGRYKVVVVSLAGETTKVKIHQLVLETFVEPRPDDRPFALHRDDDQDNNSVANLYWGTWDDNLRDKERNGKTNSHINKTRCPADHPYDYIDPRGGRQCKTCRREARRRSTRKIRAAIEAMESAQLDCLESA